MSGFGHQFPGVQQSSGFSVGLQSGGIGMFPPTSVVGISPSAMMISPGAAAFSMQQSIYQAGVLPVQHFMAPGYHTVQSFNGTMRPVPVLSHQPPASHPKQSQNNVDDAKQRHFVEQQKRLQQFSSRSSGGEKKMDADTLIASIIGKTDSRHSNVPQKSSTPSVPIATSTSSHATPCSDVDDSFGDFLSGVPGTMSASSNGSIPNQQPVGVPIEAPCSAPQTLTISPSIVPDAEKHEKKDLQSMMMECFDMSAPKQAQIINNKKPAVRDVSVTKVSSVKYNESCTARHWSNDPNENLSTLFTLPAPPPASVHVPPAIAQPSITQPIERPVTKKAPSANPWGFPLPRWVTGELPAPELYLSVLQAVTSSEGCIDTDLVYPVLLRSNLPNDVLGYLWELCNKTTPGQLVREELFLILAMISIAQNNMDYRSLGILTRCLQAPIPNLEKIPQAAHVDQSTNQSNLPFYMEVAHQQVVGAESQLIPVSVSSDSRGFTYGTVPVDPVSLAVLPNQLPIPILEHNLFGSASQVKSETAASMFSGPTMKHNVLGGTASQAMSGPVATVFSDIRVEHNVLGGTAPQTISGMATSVFSGVNSLNPAVHDLDDDDFADFQAATMVANPVQLQNSSFNQPSQMLRNPAQVDLFQATEDKYDAFRMLSFDAEMPHVFGGSGKTQVDKILDCVDDKVEFADFSSFHEAPVVNPPMRVDINNQAAEAFPSSTSLSNIVAHSGNYSIDSSLFKSVTFNEQPLKDRDFDDSSLFKSASFVEEPHKARDFDDSSLFKSASFVEEPHKARDFEDDWQDFQFVPATNSCSKDDNATVLTLSGGSGNLFEAGNSSLFSSKIAETNQNDRWHKPLETNFDGRVNDAGQLLHFNAGFETENFKMANAFTGHSNLIKTSVAEESDWTKASIKLPKPADAAAKMTLFNVKALDFLPPDFPLESDSKDEDNFFSNGTSSKGANGLSTLANLDLEEDSDTMVAKVRWKMSSQSSQDQENKPESPNWDSWTGAMPKMIHRRVVDDHSTGVCPAAIDDSDSPSRDSHSESSLEWSVPIATTNFATAGVNDVEGKSVKSLELNSCQEEMTELRNVPSVSPCQEMEPVQFIGWQGNETMKTQAPVDVKDLLNQGSLGVFGDRYSHLIGELQANDRHAYEWERCLEHCRNLLTQVEDSFSSVSSSAVCHELEVVEDGANFLSDLTEVYLVARRIIAEMKAVSISNARLGLLVRDIEETWGNLSAVFSKSPYMTSCLSCDLSPALIMTSDDPQHRSNACGLCLLNVQWDSRCAKISFGGRSYHAACANFWINFVDLTLPSLTVPELL